MLSYILRRVLLLIPMALVISFLVYLGLDLTPGDPVSYMIPPDMYGSMDPERLQALRESLGLGQPFIVRYGIWLWGVLHGNFGYSMSGGVPISTIVGDRLPANMTSVGMRVQVDHMQPTAVGHEVRAEAVLRYVEGRKMIFAVSVEDDRGLIAAGKVVRVAVDIERFMNRTV